MTGSCGLSPESSRRLMLYISTGWVNYIIVAMIPPLGAGRWLNLLQDHGIYVNCLIILVNQHFLSKDFEFFVRDSWNLVENYAVDCTNNRNTQ